MIKRTRRVGTIWAELLKKSREAALTAVQIFNNPTISFKSETYTVLMIIAWTYLFHAYFRKSKIEYRYYEMAGTKKRYGKTKYGANKYWGLKDCLNCKNSPIDEATKTNLEFLIGLRDEIEHRMTTRIDDTTSARFQACCLNYNHYIKNMFGDNHSIEKHLAVSLQFTGITPQQKQMLDEYSDLPSNIKSYFIDFDNSLPESVYHDPQFSYRLFFIPKTANRKGQADQVIEFIKADSLQGIAANKEYVVKEIEKEKYLPSAIVQLMQDKGYKKFKMEHHVNLWKNKDARNKIYNYGVQIAKQWYWYENWVKVVTSYCEEKKDEYQSNERIPT